MRTITNPYPDGYREVGDVSFRTPLALIRPPALLLNRIGEDGDYVLAADYEVSLRNDGDVRLIVVPRGFITVLTSVPRPSSGCITELRGSLGERAFPARRNVAAACLGGELRHRRGDRSVRRSRRHSGTSSTPQPPPGRQREMRRSVSQVPRMAPWRRSASRA